jgi:hypothetical protein
MRPDSLGMFWRDEPIIKPEKKEKPKRTPPPRTWEAADYRPGLAEAEAFDVDEFTDLELWQAKGDTLVFDIECYPNYFEIGFRSITSGKVVVFELSPLHPPMDLRKLEWIVHNFRVIGFNSMSYDLPLCALAIAGKTNAELYGATFEIIVNGTQAWHVLRSMKVKQLRIDHVDLIEVAPLSASLKIYGGRIHSQRMQDLPFAPGTVLDVDQMLIVRWYNINDLNTTRDIYNELREQLALRVRMSEEYKVDLRSKSDAQIAEAVIATEWAQVNQRRPTVPEIAPGTIYRYNVPSFLRFQTPTLRWVLDLIRSTYFVVSEYGNIALPESLNGLNIPIGSGVYRMGTGGLHSSETSYCHIADDTFTLCDVDVESFYPRIILNQELYPPHLGQSFLMVYQGIVNRRLHAKKAAKDAKKKGDKVEEAKWKAVSDSLKITINGSFGKFGSMYSVLYAPHLVIQVTISGQLSLLMLIERMELANIPVISANTDGVVMRVPKGQEDVYKAIVQQWEKDTHYVTEESLYSALYSRDVNNYIAVKTDGDVKFKGAFANPWQHGKKWSIPNSIWRFHKNPQNTICTEAVIELLTDRIPVERTIRECKDITKFVTVRRVDGGAVKMDAEGRTQQYLGKSVRWYYAKDQQGEIVYAKTGNRVSRSVGAKPCMDLPSSFPDDVDHEWYIKEAEQMLRSLGYV